MKKVYRLALFSSLYLTLSVAQGAEHPAACQEALTVFQDVSSIGRKDRAAKNMTQKHVEMAEYGWRLIDVEVYTENGDLEGFFLSYVRDNACADTPPGQAAR